MLNFLRSQCSLLTLLKYSPNIFFHTLVGNITYKDQSLRNHIGNEYLYPYPEKAKSASKTLGKNHYKN